MVSRLIRPRQRALTALSPHPGGGPGLIVPSRLKGGGGPPPPIDGPLTIVIGTDGAGLFGYKQGEFGSLVSYPFALAEPIELTVEEIDYMGLHRQTTIYVEYVGGLLPGVDTFLINDSLMPDYRVVYMRPEPFVTNAQRYRNIDVDIERFEAWQLAEGQTIVLTQVDTTGSDLYMQSRYIVQDGGVGQARWAMFFNQSQMQITSNPTTSPLQFGSGENTPSNAREWWHQVEVNNLTHDVMFSNISGLVPDLEAGVPAFDVWTNVGTLTGNASMTLSDPTLGVSRNEFSVRRNSDQVVLADRRVIILERF